MNMKKDSKNLIKVNFNPYVHGARGLFASMIVVFHAFNSGLPSFLNPAMVLPYIFFRSFEHGVELFFAISGIVIVGALRRARGPFYFIIERGTRIYPVLWVTIFFVLATPRLVHFHKMFDGTFVDVLANGAALPPILYPHLIHPAAWSLSYEMVFYGLCALVWAARRFLKGTLSIVATTAVAALALWVLALHMRAILMPVGMLIALALSGRSPQQSAQLGAFKRSWLGSVTDLSLICFLMSWELLCEGAPKSNLMAVDLLYFISPRHIILFIVSITTATCALSGIFMGRGLLSRLLTTKFFQFLGTISYSLYLWHPLVMGINKSFLYKYHLENSNYKDWSQVILFVTTVLLSVPLAWLSQLVLEKHVTRTLRGWLEPNVTPHAPATSQASMASK